MKVKMRDVLEAQMLLSAMCNTDMSPETALKLGGVNNELRPHIKKFEDAMGQLQDAEAEIMLPMLSVEELGDFGKKGINIAILQRLNLIDSVANHG